MNPGVFAKFNICLLCTLRGTVMEIVGIRKHSLLLSKTMPFLDTFEKLHYKFNKLIYGIEGIPIRQKDIGPHGLTIKCKGKYYFAENITWCPKKSGTESDPVAAITIRANNVLLDLNGYSLRQKGNASIAIGIFITNGSNVSTVETVSPQHPALNNITVRNGTIERIATGGILVNKVNNLTFDNLNITKNGYSGFIVLVLLIELGVLFTCHLHLHKLLLS